MSDNESSSVKEEDNYIAPRDRIISYFRQRWPKSAAAKSQKDDKEDCVGCRIVGTSVPCAASIYLLLSSKRGYKLYPDRPSMQVAYMFTCGFTAAALLTVGTMVCFGWSVSDYKDCRTTSDFAKKEVEIYKETLGKLNKVFTNMTNNVNSENKEDHNIKKMDR